MDETSLIRVRADCVVGKVPFLPASAQCLVFPAHSDPLSGRAIFGKIVKSVQVHPAFTMHSLCRNKTPSWLQISHSSCSTKDALLTDGRMGIWRSGCVLGHFQVVSGSHLTKLLLLAQAVPTLDTLFKKTATQPKLYWLPLTEAQAAATRAVEQAAEAGTLLGNGKAILAK